MRVSPCRRLRGRFFGRKFLRFKLGVSHTESMWQSLADTVRHILANRGADTHGATLALFESLFLADEPGVGLPLFRALKHAATL